MKMYIDRNNIQAKNSDFIAVGIFEVGQLLLFVYEIGLIAIREVSPPFGEEPCTALEQGLSFILFFRRLTKNADSYGIVNRYRWI